MAKFQSNLINEIKKHPCLFIEDNAVFRDQDLKNQAWNEISRKLNLDVQFLQRVWKKLRECYRIVLFARIRAKMSKPEHQCQKQWRFEEQMKFMEYYLQPKRRFPLKTGSLTEQRIVVQTSESESMETSSSALTSKTTDVEREMASSTLTSKTTEVKREMASSLLELSKLFSLKSSATGIGLKVRADDKSPFPSHRLKKSLPFRNLPKNYETARRETDIPAGRATTPAVKPETSVAEKVQIPESTTESEVEIVYETYQGGNRRRGNGGFRKRTGVFTRTEVPFPEITNETIENEVVIVYEGNPLDNRVLEHEEDGDVSSSGPSKIFCPSPSLAESEVIIESDDE